MKDNTKVVEHIKQLIDKNGPDYLKREPYRTYQELKDAGDSDDKTLAALLCALARGIPELSASSEDAESLSGKIRSECGFNKRISDALASIFTAVYTKENTREWDAKRLEGWQEFRKLEMTVSWEGSEIWEPYANAVYVDCEYEAEITIKPDEKLEADKKLAAELSRNPFLTLDEIQKHYERELIRFLDCKFEYYCTSDDYYPPVVEDFGIESYVQKWCEQNGFTLIEASGNGSTGNFKPK